MGTRKHSNLAKFVALASPDEGSVPREHCANILKEVWRVKYTLAKIHKAARDLLTLEDILGLKVEDFLERRLQTQVLGANRRIQGSFFVV